MLKFIINGASNAIGWFQDRATSNASVLYQLCANCLLVISYFLGFYLSALVLSSQFFLHNEAKLPILYS